MAPEKEIHFFDLHFERGVEWYRTHFSGAKDEIAVGEASPLYLYHPEAVPRMTHVIPTAKLVAVLRDPVERAYSHYWYNRSRGNEPLDFLDAIEAESDRLREPGNRALFAYLDRSRYGQQLQRVCRYFPRSALHVLLFEDLRDSPQRAFRSLCQFIGVDDGFVPSRLHRPFNVFVSLRTRNLIQRMPRLVGRVLGRINTRRSAAYPAMNPEVRARLVEEFAEERAAVALFLGRDLSEWERM